MAQMAASISAVLVIGFLLLLSDEVWASKYEGIPDDALPTSSGYLTVNNVTGASIFYVYYEAQSPEGGLSETPIVLWLQGGPGCSGLLGNFYELGPWVVREDQQFYPNSGTWNRIYGLLFFDQPMGTGFSVAPSDSDVPTSDEETARDMYLALEAFYTLNSFQSRSLYVAGESYAGKYAPSLGYYVVEQTAAGAITPSFQLKGVAIGNGLTDPIRQIPVYAPAAYYMGLIDWDQKKEIDAFAQDVVTHIEEGRYDLAHDSRSMLMRSLRNKTRLPTFLDIRRSVDYSQYPNGTDYVEAVVNKPSVKKALGVIGNVTWEECSDYVSQLFRNLTMRSTKYMVEAILPHISVLLYQGQFDLQDGVASNEAWMRELNWTEAAKFWASSRKVWTLKDETAGYIRSHETLANVVILGAGHLAPTDQGARLQKMLEAWIAGSLASLDTQGIGTSSHQGRQVML